MPNGKVLGRIGSWQQTFVPTCSERIKVGKARAIRPMEICVERARAQKKALSY
jgi:hypothetical protein